MRLVAQTEDLSDLIELHVGCRIEYLAEEEGTHAVVLLEPHSSLRSAILAERWEPEPAPASFTDIYGNVCRRVDLGPDRSVFAYDATVAVSPFPESHAGRERRPASHRGASVRVAALAPAEPPVRVGLAHGHRLGDVR